jgi:hypothetical protein
VGARQIAREFSYSYGFPDDPDPIVQEFGQSHVGIYTYTLNPEIIYRKQIKDRHLEYAGILGMEIRQEYDQYNSKDKGDKDIAGTIGGYASWHGVSLRAQESFFFSGGGTLRESNHLIFSLGYAYEY